MVSFLSFSSYERRCIQDWFSRGNKTSPMTGTDLADDLVLPNLTLRNAILSFRSLRKPS